MQLLQKTREHCIIIEISGVSLQIYRMHFDAVCCMFLLIESQKLLERTKTTNMKFSPELHSLFLSVQMYNLQHNE